jgi:hypothetical protein
MMVWLGIIVVCLALVYAYMTGYLAGERSARIKRHDRLSIQRSLDRAERQRSERGRHGV